MRTKRLGRTGLDVSEIAFGGVEIGIPYGVGVHSEADMLSRRDAIRLLRRAVDEGINFFDTARLYGESEAIMGEALKSSRGNIVLASKCRHLRQADGKLMPQAALQRFILDSLEESLTKLQTDYIDLYMVHYADEEILQSHEVADVFSKIKKEGLARAIGVSVYKVEETKNAVETGIWDAIQLPFNLMDQSHGVHFKQAQENGMGIIVRSVLMRGMLTNRKAKLHEALASVERHIERYQTLLGAGFADLPQLATKFALAHQAVSSVLVGIDKEQYLLEALAASSGDEMGVAVVNKLQGMAYPEPSFLNLTEWDKKGWL